jgi:ribA/ribD-fused uncharacterized protein
VITEFQGDYRWLSNFFPVWVVYEGIQYPSIEHAYMSAKSFNELWRKKCSDPEMGPVEIKRLGMSIALRPDWEVIKVEVMAELVDQKFDKEPFRTKLLDTGDCLIQEGNRWGDKFWGVCLRTNQGKNTLGKLIMEKRERLRRTEYV